MIGLGTLINSGGIVLGGLFGLLFGKLLKERHQTSLCKACGISVMFIAVAGAMEQMLTIEKDGLTSGKAMLVTVCLSLGALIGEIINIEGFFEKFGEWLKRKTGNSGDNNFVNGFMSASFTVSIGAMAIMGAIQDGISGDWSILATKAILDFIIVMVMTGSMGVGCIFSAIPVFVIQGAVTLLAVFIKPYMTDLAVSYISLVGSILIFCVGINLVWGKKINVANMVPSVIFAVAAAFLPVAW
ncbi:MAG: DUF554 domain-containing protein [Clostridiales bacterium]|nr:DUF554 domain-containing protein [Clostridiales bacterium]